MPECVLTCSEKVSSRSVSISPLGGRTYSFDLRSRLEPCKKEERVPVSTAASGSGGRAGWLVTGRLLV